MKYNIKTYETANTTPIINLPCVSAYVSKAAAKNPGWFIGMHANHKDRLLKDWGRQDFCYTGEFRHWVWVRKLPSGGLVWVFTGNKGTSFEVNVESARDKDFQEELLVWLGDFYQQFGKPVVDAIDTGPTVGKWWFQRLKFW